MKTQMRVWVIMSKKRCNLRKFTLILPKPKISSNISKKRLDKAVE